MFFVQIKAAFTPEKMNVIIVAPWPLATGRWLLAVARRLFIGQTIILLCVCTVCTSCRYPHQPTIWCPFLPNQMCFRAFYLPLLLLATNQKIQPIHFHLIRRSGPQEMDLYCHLHTGTFIRNLSPYIVSLWYPHFRQCEILSCFINLRIDGGLRGILYNEYIQHRPWISWSIVHTHSYVLYLLFLFRVRK